ncbi:MAG: DNA-binding transcriptional regulator [Burkholderiaceae bacterium]
MAAVRPVNVVVRALKVLRALNGQPVSSLDTLYKLTGLPKPTLVRLLHTLESDGLVKRAPQYGAWYLTSEVRALASGYHSEPHLVEASSAIADALTQQLRWPVSVAVPDGDAVVVRYSTIPNSPLSFFHSTINMRLSMFDQALGRAWLAFCDAPAREALIALLLQNGISGQPPPGRDAEIRHMLDAVRAQGYALRDPRVRPESSTIAVPVFDGPRVVASLGLTWFSSALNLTKATEEFHLPLRDSAGQIALALARLR